MLAPKTRAALRVGAVLYLALGLVLFAAPAWVASVFPWSVSPLVAMTIGGWALGNGAGAWFASAAGPAARTMPVLLYLTVFAAAQLLVVIAFRAVLRLDVILAIPYLLILAFTLVASAFGLLELRSSTRIVVDDPVPLSRNVRIALGALTVFVAALAVGGFIAGQGGLSTSGRIFPEPLALFTVRAFAASYAALAVGLLALLLRPDAPSAFTLGLTGVGLMVPVVAAALLNIAAFDFVARPLGILYLAAYLGVLLPALAFLWRRRDLA